jgi:hypothetical protein
VTKVGRALVPITRIQAFLMSLLSRQLALAQDSFLTRYPSAWLVWEPGEWSVPVSGVDVSVAETKLPSSAPQEQRPLGGDALCFSLKAPEGAALKIGRAADNEIVVSDMTVSRLHARLDLQNGRWLLIPMSETRKTALGGKSVSRGKPVALSSGEELELGGVKVTFYDAPAFKTRVASSVLKPRR